MRLIVGWIAAVAVVIGAVAVIFVTQQTRCVEGDMCYDNVAVDALILLIGVAAAVAILLVASRTRK